MKNCAAIAVLTLSSTVTSQLHAEGATIGIGVGINDDYRIYLPIKTDRLLIEPAIIYNDAETDSNSSRGDSSTTEIGVGIFKYTNVKDRTFIYYGTRLGYIETEQNSRNTEAEVIARYHF